MSKIKAISTATIALWALLAYAPLSLSTTTTKTTESSTAKNVISDSAVTAAVKAKFLIDDTIKGMDIHVRTVNGKVILTGKVPSTEVEEHAILVALNTDGAKEVISRLKLNK